MAAIAAKRAPTTNIIAPAVLLEPNIAAPLIQPLQQKHQVVRTLFMARETAVMLHQFFPRHAKCNRNHNASRKN